MCLNECTENPIDWSVLSPTLGKRLPQSLMCVHLLEQASSEGRSGIVQLNLYCCTKSITLKSMPDQICSLIHFL